MTLGHQVIQQPLAENVPRAETVTLARLEDQIAWYDRKSGLNKKLYKNLKALQIVVTAAIPLTSIFLEGKSPAQFAAILGAMAVIAEGLLQLWRYQENWIGFRATSEALKHEKFLYLANAGPYAVAADAGQAAKHEVGRKLAERVEALISRESAIWIDSQKNKEPASASGANAAGA